MQTTSQDHSGAVRCLRLELHKLVHDDTGARPSSHSLALSNTSFRGHTEHCQLGIQFSMMVMLGFDRMHSFFHSPGKGVGMENVPVF